MLLPLLPSLEDARTLFLADVNRFWLGVSRRSGVTRQDDDPLVHFVVSMPSRLLPRVLDSLSLSLSLSVLLSVVETLWACLPEQSLCSTKVAWT